MNYPKFYFVDKYGSPFDKDDQGIQYTIQYNKNWFIQVDHEWNGGIIIEGNPSIKLEFKNRLWQLPNITKRQNQVLYETIKNAGGKGGGSGLITAKLTDQSGKILEDSPSAQLFIEVANFSEQQFQQMIKEIGLLALSSSSCVNRNIDIPIQEKIGELNHGYEWLAGRGNIVTATSLFELAEVFKANWSAIAKRPLKSIKHEKGIVNINKAHSFPQMLIQAKINPQKKSMIGMSRIESVNCPENEFLCYILDNYLIKLGENIVELLKNLRTSIYIDERHYPENLKLGALSPQQFNLIQKAKNNYFNPIQKQQKYKDGLSQKLLELKIYISWAKKIRNSSFLANIKTPNNISSSSLRLTGNPNYGAIYQKFRKLKGGTLNKVSKILSLLDVTQNGTIRPVWNIYEIWCLINLYNAFQVYGNMQPPKKSLSLMESIKINKYTGTLEIPKDQEFILERTLDKNQKLIVKFKYEPRFYVNGSGLRPDIYITVITPNDTYNYCFDAKYRDYSKQGGGVLIDDILGTARDKYLNKLNTTASFILHSDTNSNTTINYWGEIPLQEKLRELKDKTPYIQFTDNINVDKEKGYVSHKYGAISLIPDTSKTQGNLQKQLQKILKMVLQYHSRLLNICLCCGEYVKEPISITNSRTQGACYSCPQCGNFWLDHWCNGSGHKLLKCQDSFHRLSNNANNARPEKNWWYRCPECGSD